MQVSSGSSLEEVTIIEVQLLTILVQNRVGPGESLLENLFLARNLAFLYNENSMQKHKSDDWSAGRIKLLSQIIDQQIKTNRHDHRVHSDPL